MWVRCPRSEPEAFLEAGFSWGWRRSSGEWGRAGGEAFEREEGLPVLGCALGAGPVPPTPAHSPRRTGACRTVPQPPTPCCEPMVISSSSWGRGGQVAHHMFVESTHRDPHIDTRADVATCTLTRTHSRSTQLGRSGVQGRSRSNLSPCSLQHPPCSPMGQS